MSGLRQGRSTCGIQVKQRSGSKMYGSLWVLDAGTILTVQTPQARDKPAYRSHHAQDVRKHDVFEATGA